MTFDEWADGKPVWTMDAKEIWDAAIKAERAACVIECATVIKQAVTGGSKDYLVGRKMGATVCMNDIAARG